MNEHELASWGRRLAALLVDFAVLILVIATALIAAGVPAEELRDRVREGETLLVVVLFLIPEAIYYTALIGSRSQTLGKMALGIKVVDAESRSPIGYAARVHALALDGDPPRALHDPDRDRPSLATP